MGSDTGTVFQLTFRGGFIIGLTAGESKASAVSYASERVFGGTGSLEATSVKDGSASAQIPNCPNRCKSGKIHRDGLRYNKNNSVIQRWKCTCCGERFSDKALKSPQGLVNSCQICAEEAKNLGFATKSKTVAGEKKPKQLDRLPQASRGLITEYMAYLERNGYNADISYPQVLTHLVHDGADLLDPENVKKVIAQQLITRTGEPWTNSMKMLATCAYDAFLKMKKMSWERPTYIQNEATIAVPNENDLDSLIGNSSKRLATFLQCLKETFADPTEILRVEWIDIDFQTNILSINHPVKRHYPGKYELSNQLMRMINVLPRRNKRVFTPSYNSIYQSLHNTRKITAEKLQNPALLQITFKSFRHWGGSMLAHLTNGNVPEMARIMRHKTWKNTQKYVHSIPYKDDDFEISTATSSDEILALGKAGWQKYDEAVFNGVHIHYYRKPKRFGSHKIIKDKSQKEGIGI
jgi:integrase